MQTNNEFEEAAIQQLLELDIQDYVTKIFESVRIAVAKSAKGKINNILSTQLTEQEYAKICDVLKDLGMSEQEFLYSLIKPYLEEGVTWLIEGDTQLI